MNPYRVRILLADQPGRLGRAAMALSRIGINILDVDVQSGDGELWADDLLIDPYVPIDPSTIDHALSAVGVEMIDMRAADPHEVVDSTVHCLGVVHNLVGREITDDVLTSSARLIVRAELTWLTPIPLLALSGATAQAMITGTVATGREQVKLLPAAAGAWILAVPFDVGGTRRVLTLIRRAPSFSLTEAARVEALLRVAASFDAASRPRLQRGENEVELAWHGFEIERLDE